jgi:carbon-monoxide dehydrogenase small subunit
MALHKITLTVNGSTEMVDVPSNLTLLQMLRDRLVLTGTKDGCAAGECGACTVIMTWPGAKYGEPVNSCMVLAVECDGAQITYGRGVGLTRRPT